MQDGTKAGEAVGRTLNVLSGAQNERSGKADGASRAAIDRRPYSDLPDRGGKWPRPVRVVFIAGSAAALWGLIFLGIRYL